jgi:hypothetical protein
MKNSGGVYVKLNGNLAVQKVAGSNGVGATKSVKATVQTKAGGRVGGGNTPASVEPKSKKKQAK